MIQTSPVCRNFYQQNDRCSILCEDTSSAIIEKKIAFLISLTRSAQIISLPMILIISFCILGDKYVAFLALGGRFTVQHEKKQSSCMLELPSMLSMYYV